MSAETAALPTEFGTWDEDPGALRCPRCGVQVKWGCADTARVSDDRMPVWIDCQDGARVSRRFPGVGPECPWRGGYGYRDPDGTMVLQSPRPAPGGVVA